MENEGWRNMLTSVIMEWWVKRTEAEKISRAIYSIFIELYLNQYMCLFINVLFIGHMLYGRENKQ